MMHRTLSLIAALILAVGLALLELSGSALGIVTVHVIVLAAFVLMLAGRRTTGQPGRLRRWFTWSEHQEGPLRFHVVPLVLLVGVFLLGLLDGWTAQYLPAPARVVLIIGFTITALAYGVNLLYELALRHGLHQKRNRGVRR